MRVRPARAQDGAATGGPEDREEGMVMHRFETPGHVHLRIENPAGRITVSTGDTAFTEIELAPLSAGAHAFIERTRIEAPLRDGSHAVLVAVPEARELGVPRQAEVAVSVHVPHGADLGVKAASAGVRGRGRFASAALGAASGDVDLEEIAGEAGIQTASGDISLRSVAGELRSRSASGRQWVGHVHGTADVEAASGDVQVLQAEGDVRIRTSSGDVQIGSARAGVRVRTNSGDQRIGSVERGEVTLQSSSGDLMIGVAPGSRLAVEARTVSGAASSEIPLEGEQAMTDTGPLVELHARTVSGDIRIIRAAGRPVGDT